MTENIRTKADFDQARITLLDLDSRIGPFSPSTWKTRYALNFKGIQFNTLLVDFVDIEPLCKRIGAEPAIRVRKPGSDEETVIYTLPVIYDPNTGRTVSESLAIAEYLDETYPAPTYPALVRPGTRAFTRALLTAIDTSPKAMAPLYPFIIPATFVHVHDRSKAYFRATRELQFGMKLEEITPRGADRAEAWERVEMGFNMIAGWYRGSKWIMEDEPCYADLVVAAFLMWVRKVFGESSTEWRDVKKWNNGKWERHMEACMAYEDSSERSVTN
ncbi:hypothetical protein D9611_011731 [Ephemerocybe angulata]|uniref:GST N-terminal domain-containing protein n=1 Tax=Ephemerocybe angulata TaxID=980116 RepID=A0A8H5C4Z8_9AGAR|nr:hypothetical protein D9611_011731 [Tulosesus angulatus]